MYQQFMLVSVFILIVQSKHSPDENLPSVILQEDHLDDSITQIFNYCKCVIYYLCDEDNFIIPRKELQNTKVVLNYPLRRVNRLRCSNQFYYCCKNKTTTPTTTPIITSLPPPQITYQNRGTCGKRGPFSLRIADEFPWMVAFFQKQRTNDQYSLKCGGTLIHPRVVLTAHHCVSSSEAETLRVVARREVLTQMLMPSSFYTNVSKIIRHEAYNSGGLYNDLALIILEKPITNVAPVCLPTFDQDFSGQRCVAVGWTKGVGVLRRLRKVELPLVESQRCQNLLRNTPLGPNFSLHPSFMCAGGEGYDTRRGEGGGPLLCKDGDDYVQVGIISWGIDNREVNPPGLYTNVPYLASWIVQKLAMENIRI